MALKLSSFLQMKPNIFIYRNFGWKVALLYLMILGRFYFLLKQKEKRKIKTSVETVFANRREGSEVRTIAKDVFRGILCHYYEKVLNAYQDMADLTAFMGESIKPQGLERLDQALQKGRGVLFVTGHYGGIEYIPIYLALKGYPISVIAKFSIPQLKESLHARTKDLGLRIIDGAEKNKVLGTVMQELRDNRLVFFECDEIEEWRPSQKERISFLGKRIGLDRTINLICKRTGAEIILGLLHRYNLEEYGLVIEDMDGMCSRMNQAFSSPGEAVLKTLVSSSTSCFIWR